MQVGEEAITIAAAARPHPGEAVSGDGWRVDWHANRCRITVIDGLGHGPIANDVCQRALAALASRPDLEPLQAMQVCHAALAGTRGAAISIASIDPAAAQLHYAAIGNVEARLWQSGREQRLINYRGIVGAATRTFRLFELSLESEWLIAIHTDGVSARFELGSLLDSAGPTAIQTLADRILGEYGRQMDDATVVIAAGRLDLLLSQPELRSL